MTTTNDGFYCLMDWLRHSPHAWRTPSGGLRYCRGVTYVGRHRSDWHETGGAESLGRHRAA